MTNKKNWSGETKRYLKQVVKALTEMNVKTEVDEYNISLLADAYELYISAQNAVLESGITLVENGATKVNPACSIMIRQQGVILQMLKDFGLSVKSRKALMGNKNNELDDDSPLSQFLDMVKEDEV